ncbi:hypothetical protein [Polymorphobacter fuscus]|uniref:Flippase-like domain-containing protein n=1 Tax=Sandarakinorhabdus fusca TaxID=1439888 RepID=A0A7C9GT36_9SPHN|nr:hypothetical protein [Polymorphobacter fuscus]KAB7648393.1 hypothetical protein F9290_01345 [Polymorphobacter fuscus]MQT15909.1 hypothetical protein [Polymorphobacter fuscus]NJC07816.1 hypothetical protein [Polymorphobacter fuscus]
MAGGGSALLAPAFARINRARRWFDSPAGGRFKMIASFVMSAIILGLLAQAIFDVGWRQLVAVTPTRPLYWLLFLAFYFLQPLVDWEIFRHWWRLGWRTLAMFLKRRVMNEALFSYAGDAFMMAWAATRFKIAFTPDDAAAPKLGRGDGPGSHAAEAPIAAIKDVAIMSGLAGNLFTLLMLILAVVLGGETILNSEVDPTTVRRMIIGFALLIALSLTIVFNRNRLLTLTVAANMRSFWLHLFRVSAMHFLLVATWFVALPAIGVGTWLVLGALRLVIGRMPVPNKELLFAALAVDLTGDASVQVAALMAAQGVLYLAAHGLSWLLAIGIEASDPAPDAGQKE